MDRLHAEIWPLLAQGTIKPVIETVVPIAEAERAHALIAGDGTVGKVVLQVVE
jgi:NADPH:quinone reductase-like Zn-dependent oxidoreductase